MNRQICCARCARLPSLDQTMAGRKVRCRLCQTPLFLADGSAAAYRLVEGTFSVSKRWQLAAPVVLTAILLVGILGNAFSSSRSTEIAPPSPGAESMATSAVHCPAKIDQGSVVAQVTKVSVRHAQPPARTKPAQGVLNPGASGHGLTGEEWEPLAKPFTLRIRPSSKPALAEEADPKAKPLGRSIKVAIRKHAVGPHMFSEQQLLAQLRQVTRLDVDVPLQQQIVALESPKTRLMKFQDLKHRKTGLPFLEGDECIWPSGSGQELELRSLMVRRGIGQFSRGIWPEGEPERVQRVTAALVSCINLDDSVEFVGTWQEKTTVISLQQILMAGDSSLRGVLINCLAKIRGKTSTLSLAQRALFDQSPEVREAAIEALKQRPPHEYTPALLEGLRHPWPAVPHHAARALAALQRTEIVDKLIMFLDRADPDLPYQENGQYKVREMVRLNHHRNCLLCHPASFGTDEVRGLVPNPMLPLPDGSQGRVYYGGGTGPFVRGDITYLRQDFSVMQEVGNPGPWPAQQRFDFFVRVKDVTKAEAMQRGLRREPAASEHKKAIVFALRELTGLDAPPAAVAWRQRLLDSAR